VWDSLDSVEWVEASLRLLRAFGNAGGQRAVFVGSCAEYDWSYGLCSEAHTPTVPASLYGASKDGLRRIAEAAARKLDVSLAWARPFFLYGPYEHTDRLVPAIVRPLLRGQPAACSEGSQLRDYLHVADAAAALTALLESAATGPVNIGSGTPVRVRDIVATLGDALGRPDLIRYGAIPGSSEQAPLLLADLSRLRREVGWSPRIDLPAGLDDAIAFWRRSQSRSGT
jgi:nucleoside-diphosphate-sugar epimerase